MVIIGNTPQRELGIKETSNEDLWEFILSYMVPTKTLQHLDKIEFSSDEKDDKEENEQNSFLF